MNTAPDLKSQDSLTFTPGERRVFRLRERLTVSEWAERYRIVTNGPMTGLWQNTTTPYLVGPMNAISQPHVRRIILMFAPQTGKTQVAFNALCRWIEQDPGPCMYIMPDEKVTKRIARRRILPMFRSTSRIAELLGPGVSDTTTLHVNFTNGMDFMMAWATSAAEMSSESVRYMIRDEVDKYPDFTGKEADPIALTDQRQNAYPFTKKTIDLSTPTDESGYIGPMIEREADELMRYYAVCPVCRAPQVMHFGQINWPKTCNDPREIVRGRLAHYQCESCGMLWDDHLRNKAVLNGLGNPDSFYGWIPDSPVERAPVIGFHLPSWYSPFVSLSSCVAAYMRGMEDPSKMMVYITQHKAEVWRETVVPKKESALLDKKTELAAGIVPKDAVALTAGIDVQKSGFWFVVRAWADDLTSWLVQYGYLTAFADVENLVFNTQYPIEGNPTEMMGIWRAGIDTGGGVTEENIWTRTEEIYQWIRSQQPGRVFGTKGATHKQIGRIRVSQIDKLPRSNKAIPGGLELRLLDTDQYKALLHWRMERQENETQRFLLNADTGLDYARQILAEEFRRDRRGKTYWKQIRRDNHLLDCEVIAAACADSEWLPSLRMLATYLRQQKEQMAQRKEIKETRGEKPQGKKPDSWRW